MSTATDANNLAEEFVSTSNSALNPNPTPLASLGDTMSTFIKYPSLTYLKRVSTCCAITLSMQRTAKASTYT
jgi:hypothetical protein